MKAFTADSKGAFKVAGIESASRKENMRIHVCLDGRYVSVIQHNGKLYCIDSTCYHNGGPLAMGDIEDVDGEACIICPWHKYQGELAFRRF